MIVETLSDMKIILKPEQKFLNKYEGEEKVFADKKLLKNILFNLLSNAIKFSNDNAEIILNSHRNKSTALIEVKDKGIGISIEDQKHLFSSFFRGSNANNIQGTGLGLHIVKRYIDLMNGNVHLQSEQGKGTIVSITFPCSEIN